MILQVVFALLLGAGAIWDLVQQKVHIALLISLVLCGCLIRLGNLLEASSSLTQRLQLLSILPGLLLVLASLAALKRKVMGPADLFVLIAMALKEPFPGLCHQLGIAFVLAGMTGFLKLIFCSESSEESIPLIPFLFLGYLL